MVGNLKIGVINLPNPPINKGLSQFFKGRLCISGRVLPCGMMLKSSPILVLTQLIPPTFII